MDIHRTGFFYRGCCFNNNLTFVCQVFEKQQFNFTFKGSCIQKSAWPGSKYILLFSTS